jgi:multicomponent Na+:H+ antiporter subunit E
MSFLRGSVMFALIWVAVTGAFTLANLLLGWAFGAAALYVLREQTLRNAAQNSGPRRPVFKRIGRIASLIGLFAYEMMMSAIKVTIMVLRQDMNLKSGIFAYETQLTKDSQITLLANLITLTPGTLTVDVSDDERILYIHAVDCSDIKAACDDIRNGFERKIKEASGDFV